MRGRCAIGVVATALMAWTGVAAQETKSGTNGTVTPDDYRIGPEDKAISWGGEQEDFYVQPGDIVVVP